MAAIHDLWLFVLSGLLLNLTPGPDTAYIVGRSLQRGWPGGASAALGIGAGTFVHILASTLGLSALIATSAIGFSAVKFAGAAYLLFVGWRMLTRPAKTAPDMTLDTPPDTVIAARPNGQDLRTIFWQGFTTNVLNPKVALFFLAFLPQFITPAAPQSTLGLLILGLVFDVNGTASNLVIAACAARIGRQKRVQQVLRHRIEQAIGGLFILVGLRLAFSTKS